VQRDAAEHWPGAGSPAAGNATTATAVIFDDIVKSYGATHALNGVSFAVRRGSVHALLGGNGSGKSTLIKILAGIERADSGRVIVGGAAHDVSTVSPGWARAKHLHFVHQDFGIFPALTVAENLSVGRGFERDPLGRIQWSKVNARARSVCRRFGLDVSPTASVSSLAPAQRTLLAIARTLQDQDGEATGVLVLDEPTVALPDREVSQLLKAVAKFASAGQAVILVTHRLQEAYAVADEITVLRDGQLVASEPAAQLDRTRLISLIAGNAGSTTSADETQIQTAGRPSSSHDSATDGGVVAKELRPWSNAPPISFESPRGQILGVAGLLGAGRSRLLRLLGGVDRAAAGTLLISGQPVDLSSHRSALRCGVNYVPEDRTTDGLFGSETVEMNLTCFSTSEFSGMWWFSARRRRRLADRLIATFGVVGAGSGRVVTALSGGNQQKVLLSRWMQSEPRLLLLDEPTKGVDVRARADIHHLIRTLAARGSNVLVVSSDTEELAALCDRVLVLTRGELTADLAGADVTTVAIQTAIHSTSRAEARTP